MKIDQKGTVPVYLIVIILIVVVVAIGVGAFLYWQSQNKNDTEPKDSQSTSTSETATEPASPKTEIKVQGQNATLVISPSVDKEISGTVTVTVTQAPEGTKMALFTIQGGDVKVTGPNLGIDSDGSDGWSRIVDTTKYDNGVYEIAGLPSTTSEGNPLGRAVAQVIIKN
jgi:uncharacterized protein (UPF0333 family)